MLLSIDTAVSIAMSREMHKVAHEGSGSSHDSLNGPGQPRKERRRRAASEVRAPKKSQPLSKACIR